MKMIYRVLIIVMALVLASCGHYKASEYRKSSSGPSSSFPIQTETDEKEPSNIGEMKRQDEASSQSRHQSLSSVQHLLTKAEGFRKEGKWQSAESSLDRAYRIDPSDPHVFLGFSKLYRTMDLTGKSKDMAYQGLEYAEQGTAVYRQLQALTRN